jgi:SAM-dependent methyltransferase
MQTSGREGLIVRRSATNLYGAGQEVWVPSDRWNYYKRIKIERFILRANGPTLSREATLDVGAGNSLYEWMPHDVISADRYHGQVIGKKRAIVCDLEMLPFKAESFDLVFCIGSVLNYVSALEAIQELSRIITVGGRLFLHFETSASFEQIARSSWNAQVFLNKTVNSSRIDQIWIYSPAFIYNALNEAGFRILQRSRFHILSALLTRAGISQNWAAWAARLDVLFSWLGMFADDIIVLAEKI